jgi:hypothetical protein
MRRVLDVLRAHGMVVGPSLPLIRLSAVAGTLPSLGIYAYPTQCVPLALCKGVMMELGIFSSQ